MQKIDIKRGETLEIFGTLIQPDALGVAVPIDISTWQLYSQIRDPKREYELVGIISVTKGDQGTNPGSYVLKADTTYWPTGRLLADVAFVEQDGDIKMSETMEISVTQAITQLSDFVP